MASQLAQTINTFRQTMPESGRGLRQGVENYYSAKQYKQKERLTEAEISATEAKAGRARFDAVMDKLIGPISGASSLEKWTAAQDSGFIPAQMKFENREPMIMQYMGKDAMRTAEVADKTSSTGRRNVPEWQAIGKEAPAGDALVKIDQSQETEENKAYGKSLVANYDAIGNQAAGAESILAQYRNAKSLNITSSGPLEPFKVSIALLAEDLGADPATFGLNYDKDAPSYIATMGNLTYEKLLGATGPQTDDDARRVSATLPTLATPEESRLFLLDAGMSVEQMKLYKQRFWHDYRTENKTFDGASEAWTEFQAKTPTVGKNPKTGETVFFPQFINRSMAKNPGSSRRDLEEFWQNNYAFD